MKRIGITRVKDTGEFKVYWRGSGIDREARAYYTEDPEDAALTLSDELKRARESGEQVGIIDAVLTLRLISKYSPGLLIAETRRAVQTDPPEIEALEDYEDAEEVLDRYYRDSAHPDDLEDERESQRRLREMTTSRYIPPDRGYGNWSDWASNG